MAKETVVSRRIGNELTIEAMLNEDRKFSGKLEFSTDVEEEILTAATFEPGDYDVTFVSTALDPILGAIMIAGASKLLEQVTNDLVSVCDIKCEENETGSNTEGADYESWKKLVEVKRLLGELVDEFIIANNQDGTDCSQSQKDSISGSGDKPFICDGISYENEDAFRRDQMGIPEDYPIN